MAIAFDCNSSAMDRHAAYPQLLRAAQRLHMHRTIEPRPHHLRDAARIVAVGSCRSAPSTPPACAASQRKSPAGLLRREALNSHCDSGPASSPIRSEAAAEFASTANRAYQVGLKLCRFPNDSRPYHPQCRRWSPLTENVQSSKVVHAALLLLDALAPGTVTTGVRPARISRSAAPNLQLSTRTPARSPRYWHLADIAARPPDVRYWG